MESQQDALSVTQGNCLTLFDEVLGEAIDATLGKHLTAGLACVLIAVAGILELLASDEELEDQLVRLPAHCALRVGKLTRVGF